MEGLSPARPKLPFALHSAGAGLFALLFAWLAYRAFLSPVDLFIHHTYLNDELLRFGVYGTVFYGFSLVLLRFYPVSNFWGALYAAGSWLLFVVAFFPTLPFGSSGMMRRVADSADYETTRQAIARNIEIIRMTILFGFGLIQALFLRQAHRQMRARGTLPDVST